MLFIQKTINHKHNTSQYYSIKLNTSQLNNNLQTVKLGNLNKLALIRDSEESGNPNTSDTKITAVLCIHFKR